VAAETYWRHYQKIEYGAVNITIATMVKIAVALGSDLPTLLTERSQP
jgi:hypothetical protein